MEQHVCSELLLTLTKIQWHVSLVQSVESLSFHSMTVTYSHYDIVMAEKNCSHAGNKQSHTPPVNWFPFIYKINNVYYCHWLQEHHPVTNGDTKTYKTIYKKYLKECLTFLFLFFWFFFLLFQFSNYYNEKHNMILICEVLKSLKLNYVFIVIHWTSFSKKSCHYCAVILSLVKNNVSSNISFIECTRTKKGIIWKVLRMDLSWFFYIMDKINEKTIQHMNLYGRKRFV